MQVQAILTFNGRCEEALEFYGKALGAEVISMMRWKDSPDAKMRDTSPAMADKIMHAEFRIGESILMADDGMSSSGATEFRGIGLSLDAADDAEAKRLFAALSDGGAVRMPLAKTFWASSFGVVADRFGVQWMVGTRS